MTREYPDFTKKVTISYTDFLEAVRMHLQHVGEFKGNMASIKTKATTLETSLHQLVHFCEHSKYKPQLSGLIRHANRLFSQQWGGARRTGILVDFKEKLDELTSMNITLNGTPSENLQRDIRHKHREADSDLTRIKEVFASLKREMETANAYFVSKYSVSRAA